MRYLLISLLLSLSLHAQLPDPELTAAQRREIAEAFAKRIESTYVLAGPAKEMAAAIREHIRRGDYDAVPTAAEFAQKLMRDVRAVNDDRHLRVVVSPRVIPADHDPARPPSAEQKAQMAEEMHRVNYGLAAAKTLDGNIGYLDIELFPPVELAKATYDAAMASLAGTSALIVDARRHGGGDPAMVAHLVSWFVPEGTLINETYTRANGDVVQYRAGKLPGPRYDKKVYVLTSKRTFSGGEELAYDLQALKRATLIGEVTGGGAHPTRPFRIHERFFASIPFRQSINPVTKTNWEGVGVKPDIAVPAEEALKVAHEAALKATGGSVPARPPQEPAPQEPAGPSPARALLEAWVKSFNEHDPAARRAWLAANTNLQEAQIKEYASMDAEILADQGPFEIVRFGKVTATSAEAFAKHKKSGNGARISIALDPKDPAKIVGIGLEPADVSGPASAKSDDEIAREVAKLAEEKKFSGVVLLAKDGKPFLHAAYGLADRAANRANTLDTQFNLASVNKMWTMAAIARLVAEGKLRYDDTVGKHLPDYPNKTVREKATIEQLLTHRSGIGDYLNDAYMKAQPVKLREFLPFFASEPLEFEPGASRGYSNGGFIVLGLIVEKLTGRDYFDYVGDTILKPLGMTNTSFAAKSAAVHYHEGNRADGFIPRHGSAAGGAWSTAGDMLRFAEWVRAGEQEREHGAGRAVRAGGTPAPRVGVGLPRDGELVGHSGGIQGASADVYTFTRSGYTVVVLSNLSPPASHDVARLARRLIESKGNQAEAR